MANAIPVHSSKKGKPVNDVKADEPVQPSEGPSIEPVQPSGSEGKVPAGIKLDSHDAYRVDY
jgi:hypothetical protein